MVLKSHRESAPGCAFVPSTLCRFSIVPTLPWSAVFHETVDFLILLASVGAIKVGTAVLRQLIAMAFQSGGAAFVVAGWPIARGALVTEAALDFAVAPNASLGVSWIGEFADQSHDNALKGNFRWGV